MSKDLIKMSVVLSVLLFAGCGQNDKGLSYIEDKQNILIE